MLSIGAFGVLARNRRSAAAMRVLTQLHLLLERSRYDGPVLLRGGATVRESLAGP